MKTIDLVNNKTFCKTIAIRKNWFWYRAKTVLWSYSITLPCVNQTAGYWKLILILCWAATFDTVTSSKHLFLMACCSKSHPVFFTAFHMTLLSIFSALRHVSKESNPIIVHRLASLRCFVKMRMRRLQQRSVSDFDKTFSWLKARLLDMPWIWIEEFINMEKFPLIFGTSSIWNLNIWRILLKSCGNP